MSGLSAGLTIDGNIKELLTFEREIEGRKDSAKVEGRRGDRIRDKQTVNSERLIQYDGKHNQTYFLTSSFILSAVVFYPPPSLLIAIASPRSSSRISMITVSLTSSIRSTRSHLIVSPPSLYCTSPTFLLACTVSLAHLSDPHAHNHPVSSTHTPPCPIQCCLLVSPHCCLGRCCCTASASCLGLLTYHLDTTYLPGM